MTKLPALNGPVKNSTLITYHTVWESYPIKAGIVLNRKLEIFACYIPSAQLTDNYYAFDGSVTAYRLGLCYLFGTKYDQRTMSTQPESFGSPFFRSMT